MDRAEYDRRRAAVDAIKIDRGCVDCGYNAHPAALQFDHRDADTKDRRMGGRSLAANLTRRWSWVLAEIAKCDVRCANCHAVRTHEEGMYRPGAGAVVVEPPQLSLGILVDDPYPG